jgi:hypothetical protein
VGYRLNDWEDAILDWEEYFSSHNVQTLSGVYLASYLVVTLGVKEVDCEADHFHLVMRPRRHGAVTSNPFIFTALYFIKHSGKFAFLPLQLVIYLSV